MKNETIGQPKRQQLGLGETNVHGVLGDTMPPMYLNHPQIKSLSPSVKDQGTLTPEQKK